MQEEMDAQTIQPSPILTGKSLAPAPPTIFSSSSVKETKQLFQKPPSNYTSQTGVGDWEELVDESTSRVFFFSESAQTSQWGLPLDSLGRNDSEREKLHGWRLHIDPTTQNKYFANELKSRAQWNYPGEGQLKTTLWKVPYLRDKRSWAVEMQKKHNRPRPNDVNTSAPTVKVKTLRELIQNLTLDKVVCDREAFKAFQIFASIYHAEENVLFYCVTEAFSKRGSKAVGVLGLDDLAKPNDKGLPRTQSHLSQITLDQIRAEKLKTSVERLQMAREATGIFNRFLCNEEAKDWVFVDPNIVREIEEAVSASREDPGTPLLNRRLFARAQAFVFQNLEQDLLPRFIKASLSREREGGLEVEMMQGAHGAFTPDEVLRHHLLQLERKPDQVVTSLMSTANAYRSLFPSPRYAIEGREGSGLSPLNLDRDDMLDLGVAAQIAPKKTFNIVGRMLFPQAKPVPPPLAASPSWAMQQQQQQHRRVSTRSPVPTTTRTGGDGEEPAPVPLQKLKKMSIVELAGSELNLDLEKFDVAH